MGENMVCRPVGRTENPPASRPDCRELLRRVQQLDFAIIDVTQYLDVYPDCTAAKENLAHWRTERAKAASEYEAACGMLTMYGVCGVTGGQVPYQPWEYQAN